MDRNISHGFTGVKSPDGQLFLLDFYRYETFFKRLVKTAIENDEILKKDFKVNFQDKITRLCPEVLYAIYRLGWMVMDPLNQGFAIALASDGDNLYFVSDKLIVTNQFDRDKLDKKDAICPILTDEVLKYKESLATSLNISNGIVDEKGFVDCSVVDNVENLSSLLLMFEMMHNKELYVDYITKRSMYASAYDYMISRENVVAIDQNSEGRYNIEYVSDNDGVVQEFVKNITQNELASNLPVAKEDMLLMETESIELPQMRGM